MTVTITFFVVVLPGQVSKRGWTTVRGARDSQGVYGTADDRPSLSTDFSVSDGKLPGAGLEQCASRADDHIEPLAAITVGDVTPSLQGQP